MRFADEKGKTPYDESYQHNKDVCEFGANNESKVSDVVGSKEEVKGVEKEERGDERKEYEEGKSNQASELKANQNEVRI